MFVTFVNLHGLVIRIARIQSIQYLLRIWNRVDLEPAGPYVRRLLQNYPFSAKTATNGFRKVWRPGQEVHFTIAANRTLSKLARDPGGAAQGGWRSYD